MFNLKPHVVKRAHRDSIAGRMFRHLAFAVDAHGCLLFMCRDTDDPACFEPVSPPCMVGDQPFEELYERFLK